MIPFSARSPTRRIAALCRFMAALVLVLGITTSEVMAQMLQLPLRNPPRVTSAVPGVSKLYKVIPPRIVFSEKLFGARASIEQGIRTPGDVWSPFLQ